jgi:ribosomal protein S18 acetylase RimI-like enzyme
MEIIKATQYRKHFLEAVNRLLPQLSADARLLTADDLRRIIASNASTLLFAEDNKQIFGTLTLALFRTPTGPKARIEDFVVEEQARRQGIGKRLMEHAIRHAGQSGATTVDLTSHPARHSANAFYRKAGFKIRETNVYQLNLYEINF